MKKDKFNLLFESFMDKLSDEEIFGNDIHNAVLKIYKLNYNTNEFDNLIQEFDNFKFLEPDANRSDILNDLLMEPGDWDDNFEICKIMVFDKKTNKLLFEGITLLGTDSNDVIDLLSYNENPRGTFEGVTEESTEITEDSDKFDETYTNETIEYKDHIIHIESFDDQGDIVFIWNIDNGKLSDEKYYSTKELAINKAKAEIDFLVDGVKTEIKGEPVCPYCKRKVAKAGAFFYSCLNHGKIKADVVEYERF